MVEDLDALYRCDDRSAHHSSDATRDKILLRISHVRRGAQCIGASLGWQTGNANLKKSSGETPRGRGVLSCPPYFEDIRRPTLYTHTHTHTVRSPPDLQRVISGPPPDTESKAASSHLRTLHVFRLPVHLHRQWRLRRHNSRWLYQNLEVSIRATWTLGAK